MPSHWEGERGEFQDNDIPEAIRRLINPDAVRTYDRSSYGWSNPEERTAVEDDGNEQSIIQNHRIFTGGESVTVNELSLPQFRAMLIEHFAQHKFSCRQSNMAKTTVHKNASTTCS